MPTLDVNKVLRHPRFRAAATLLRTESTVDSYGRSSDTVVQSLIGVVMRPASEDELERLPEGDRIDGTLKILSETPLLAGDDNHAPDRVVWRGIEHIVRRSDPWLYGRGFYSALAVPVDAQTADISTAGAGTEIVDADGRGY